MYKVIDNEKAFFDKNDIHGLPTLHSTAVHRGGGKDGEDEDHDDEQQQRTRSMRENRNSYLVDDDGVQYDANSLAWRYLGLYVDCDDDGGGGQSGGGNSYCERKLLWAAYHDPRYRGNSIEEYQFYDVVTNTWDDSTCSRYGMYTRCARLDCHETNTGFRLVGVFKETDGMYDWTEQLFKHEGMCVWNDDEAYQTMEKWMNMWPTSCQQLDIPDTWGDTLYMAVKPLPGGNMTLAIYTDGACSKASSMDITTYLVKLYQSNGYTDQTGYTAAETWKDAITTWNEKMSYFKVCQPCVAYNRFSEQSKDNGHGRRGRLLGGGGGNQNNNDGNGYERKRYNCYDDAGYTNVNQCYKFETKTNLKLAYEEDLHAASNQGSILKIKAYDKVYGKGGYTTPMSSAVKVAYESFAVLSIAGLALSVLYVRRCFQRLTNGRRRIRPTSMNDVLFGGEHKDNAAIERRLRKLRRAPVDSRWIQWTTPGRAKTGKSQMANESEVKDAESLSTVSGIYDPPTCDGRGVETCIESSEQHLILENYIQLQILWNTINGVDLGRDMNNMDTTEDKDISSASNNNYKSDDMNHHDILENKLNTLENAIADVDIVSPEDYIEVRVLENAIADAEINSSVTGNGEDFVGDVEMVSSDSSISENSSRKEEMELINSHCSDSFSIRTEVAFSGTDHLYPISEGSSLSTL